MAWLHRGRGGGAGIALKREFAQSDRVLVMGLILIEVSEGRALMATERLGGMVYA